MAGSLAGATAQTAIYPMEVSIGGGRTVLFTMFLYDFIDFFLFFFFTVKGPECSIFKEALYFLNFVQLSTLRRY